MTAVSTPIATVPSPPRPEAGTGRVTQLRVIKSEWLKLRSLRSTIYSILAAVVFEVGLGTLFAALRANRWNQHHGGEDRVLHAVEVSLNGVNLAQLAIGVLGVLVITGEYSTGMIRATLTAVPRRLPVLWAKVVVFGTTAFVVMGGASLAAFLAGQAALSSTGLQASLSTPGAGRAVIGATIYLTLIGLLGVGLGFIVRSTPGAIATLFGILLVLPALANALPDPWAGDVTKLLPLSIGNAVMSVPADPAALAPWTGIGLFAVYVVVAIGVGAAVLRRRDA